MLRRFYKYTCYYHVLWIFVEFCVIHLQESIERSEN